MEAEGSGYLINISKDLPTHVQYKSKKIEEDGLEMIIS